MNKYTGIDLSLCGTGLVTIDQDCKIISQELISTKPGLTEPRIITIVDKILRVDFDHVNIEGLAFGARGQSMFELAGLHYCLRVALTRQKTEYRITTPSELKKFVTGKGNAKKELMLLKVFKKWGVEFSDNNLCDAFSLAMFCRQNNGHRQISDSVI